MKYICIIAIALCLSCDKDESPNNSFEHLKNVTGRYSLTHAYTNKAIDLNFDGFIQTDLFEEIDCAVGFPLGLYRTIIDFKPLFGGRGTLSVELPQSYMVSETEPLSQCFNNGQLNYDSINVNETGDIIIIARNEEKENELGKLISANVIDGVLRFEFDVPLFTSEGWQTVKLYMDYKKNDLN